MGNVPEHIDISVIVPVYNTYKYLAKCIDSILNQTIGSYEIILVNDGSIDDSGKLCIEYAEKNPIITVINKENGGLSDARNAGVNAAKGRYVTFIDSDDYVDSRYLEALYNPISNGICNISTVGIGVFSDSKAPSISDNIEEPLIMSGREALMNVFYQDKLDTSACALMLPHSLALVYPFPVGKYCEDEFTTYNYYEVSNLVAVCTTKLYFYYQREGSIMHSCGKAKEDELDAADNLVKVFSNDAELKKAAEAKCFSDYCRVLITTADIKKTNKETYSRITSFLRKKRLQMIFDKRTRKKNKLAAIAMLFGPNGLLLASKLKGEKW